MRVLHRYLIVDFLVIFLMALLLISFVLFIGSVVKAIDMMAKGVAPQVILQIFIYIIPFNLQFSIPMSVLVAALLLFGRLSMDGEITALKACGVSFRQIAAPVVMVSIALTGVCLWINYRLAPDSHFATRLAKVSLGEIDPMTMLEEGEWTYRFPGYAIYIGAKSENQVRDVIINDTSRPGGSQRKMRARSGEILVDREALELVVHLKDVSAFESTAADPNARQIPMDEYHFRLSYKSMIGDKNIEKRQKDMTFQELVAAIRNPAGSFAKADSERLVEERTKCMIEANKRIAMAVSCLSFTVLGIPLGMKSRRRESSAGILLSLLLLFGFYFFILLAEALTKSPHLRPDLIVWMPVIVSQVGGFLLIRKMN